MGTAYFFAFFIRTEVIENSPKIKTIKMQESMSQGGMEMNMTQTLEVNKAMRMDINAGGMSGFEIVTTKGGWMYMPFTGATDVTAIQPAMLKPMQKQLDLKAQQMLDYKSRGDKLEYTGKDTVDSKPCYKVKITSKNGNITTCYFDCSTYYQLRSESIVKVNDQQQEVAVVYKNYKKLDGGIVMPMSMNAQGAEVTFKSIEVNKPVDEKIFKPVIDKK